MNKMVRQQLFVTAEQKRRIKTRAALTGVSEGEIIRRGIDRELEQEAKVAEADWRDAWRQAFGMWKDRDDLDEFYANRRKRDKQRMERIRKQMRGK
jgi:predicted metal-dependent peptidase